MSVTVALRIPVSPITDREDDLASALAQDRGGDWVQAAEQLNQLADAWPDWDEPELRLADLLRRRGDPRAAAERYRAALGRNPRRAEALLALGAIHLSAGRVCEAEPLLRQCCALTSCDGPAWHAWGLALLLTGRPDEALVALERAHALDASNSLCGIHLADAFHALGRGAEAAAWLEAGARRDPGNTGRLVAWATALAHCGQRDEAIDVLEAATLLAPDNQVAAAVFADMLARTTRQVEAERALRRALTLDPLNNDATMALSVVLMRLHRFTEAAVLLRDLLDQAGACVPALCNLTTALVGLGRQDEAVACARRAVALAPEHPAPWRALCNALPYQAGVTSAGLLAATRTCAARLPRADPPRLDNTRVRHRRLRLGLLSGTLRKHPVGWLTVAGFEHLAADEFALVCLSPNKAADDFGDRFAAIADAWIDTGSLDDVHLAQRIRALEIDVLVDLGGYGDFGRMAALAHRAAPVQIKWVGMQNHSSGLDEMDWFITDRWETPPQLAADYVEKLIYMPDGYVCYAPPIDAPATDPSPAIRRGAITYGCYNNLAKITPQVISVWSRILRQVPNSRLVLKTHQFNETTVREDMWRAFARHGIAAERVDLRGSSPHRELLRQYCDVDIILDPFPYSGGLTTCEALWMGVPTLTMPGQTFASRHSASHMCNVGLSDWVVADEDSYVAQAVARAGDLPRLARLRDGLRAQVGASALCDAPRFGAALGTALRKTWWSWCDSV